MALVSPIKCIEQDEFHQGYYLQFIIVDKTGNEKNLLQLPGITILRESFEIKYEINKVRTFTFTYLRDEFDLDNEILGAHRNEIQIWLNKENGVKELIFDGYVDKNTTNEQLNSKISKHRVEVLGSEQVFYTDYVKGLTTFVNLTSKQILERVGEDYVKEYDNRFLPPLVEDNLDQVWLDCLNIDGQYSRLFDMIKDRENAEYIFTGKGQVHFFREDSLASGGALNSKMLGGGTTNTSLTNQHGTRNNRGIFKYKDVKGGLCWEHITNDDEKGKSVKTMNKIYDIKSITVNGESGWKKAGKVAKDKTYTYSGNTISLHNKTKDWKLQTVKIFYWIHESGGVVYYDDEGSIVSNIPMRGHSSPITAQEFSNERISSIQDVYAQTQKSIEFNNKPNYKVEFKILDISIKNSLAENLFDFHRYTWDDNDVHPELKGVEYLVPHEKSIKLRISDGCNADRIPLENFSLDVVMESNQSNRWQNAYIRDKNQQKKHEQKTISIAIHHEWDLGTCNVFGSIQYTKDNLTTQTVMAIPTDEYPKNHVELHEKFLTTSIQPVGDDKGHDIKCTSQGYLRGFLWFKPTMNYPKIDHTDRFIKLWRLPKNIGEGHAAIEAWIKSRIAEISLINGEHWDFYIQVHDGTWEHWWGRNSNIVQPGTTDLVVGFIETLDIGLDRPGSAIAGTKYYILPGGAQTMDYIKQWIEAKSATDLGLSGIKVVSVYVRVDGQWQEWAASLTAGKVEAKRIQENANAYVNDWVKIPVDLRIFKTGVDMDVLATTWGEAVEYGITGRNSKVRRHEFWYDPYKNIASLYEIPKNPNSDFNVEKHSQDDWSRKFTNWKEDWYFDRGISPYDSWDDEKCDLKAKLKHPVSADAKTGETMMGDTVNREIIRDINNPNAFGYAI